MDAEVNSKGHAVRAFESDWSLVDALWGGTPSMREAGDTYLPRFEKETRNAYDVRLNGSFLLPMFRDACEDLTSRPFSKEVTLRGEKIHKLFEEIEDDADGEGKTLTELALGLFKDGLRYGSWNLLVDYTGDGSQSVRAEESNEVRPLFIAIPPKCILGWRMEGGSLEQLRYRVDSYEEDGEYGEKLVERVIVWNREGSGANVQTFKKGDAATGASPWVRDGEDREVKPGGKGDIGIPFVSCFFSESEGIVSNSPLMDLAWKNVEHWQSASDQRNILKYSRTGLLVLQGIDDEDLKSMGGVVVGANQVLPFPSTDGNVFYAEHSGAAIESGRKDLEDIKREAMEIGSRPKHELAKVDTATGRKIDEDRSTSKLKSWIRGTELRLRRAFELALEWRGAAEEMGEGFAVDIYSDFSSGGGTADMQTLSTMQTAGQISKRTLLLEARRRGVLSEEIDPDEEIERIDEEFVGLSGLENPSSSKPATSGDEPDPGEDPEVDEG